MCWNANGLRLRKIELESFLISNDIDIALISETHLVSYSNLPKIQNYSIYVANHPSGKARGGSAILIKKIISHYDVGNYITSSIQASVISVRINNQQVQIASIYCPPRCPPVEEEFISLFRHLGLHWILGGDLNAKHPAWGSRICSPRGLVLHRAALRHKCHFLSPGSPTFWPSDTSKLPDIIDFFLTKGLPLSHFNAKCTPDLSSDHAPVTLTFAGAPVPSKKPAALVNHSTDWDCYRELVDSNIELNYQLQNVDDLDQAAENFASLLTNSTQACTTYTEQSPPEVIYPNFIRHLVLCRRRARKAWQRNRTSANKTMFNRLNNDTNRAIKSWRNDSFASYLTSLAPTKEAGYSLWTATKRIPRPPFANPPLKLGDNNWARSDLDKAELFSQHFEKVFQPNDIQTTINPHFNLDGQGQIHHSSPLEVAKIIDGLRLRKSPGLDRVSAIMLRELPKRGIIFLAKLINAALRLKHVPRAWKIAKLIVILKPGKPPEDPSSYRPISLISIIAKIFEKVVLSRMQSIVIKKDLLPSFQFGFREKHSTIEQVHRIYNIARQALENKEFAPAAFLDVSAAFDKVWHEGLIYKLSRHFPGCFCKLLNSYLTDRYFVIHHGCATSQPTLIQAGIPQGSVLGPMLYLLYTNDIPQSANITTGLFADDTAIISHNSDYYAAVSSLQLAINNISKWAKDWKISLNESKSVRVDFALRSYNYSPVYLDGKVVPASNAARYLGLHLDSKLNWQEHIANKRQLLDLQLSKFYWLVGRGSSLNLRNKRLIYISIFRPMWTYGAELWGAACPSNILKIEQFQNKFLRTIVNAPWFVTNKQLQTDLNIEPVDVLISQQANRYISRLHNHPNVEAISLLDTTNDTRRLHRKHPIDLIN